MTKIAPDKVKIFCPNCGSSEIEKSPENGDVYCKKCGTIIEELMDF